MRGIYNDVFDEKYYLKKNNFNKFFKKESLSETFIGIKNVLNS
jgi:hypothetical protein